MVARCGHWIWPRELSWGGHCSLEGLLGGIVQPVMHSSLGSSLGITSPGSRGGEDSSSRQTVFSPSFSRAHWVPLMCQEPSLVAGSFTAAPAGFSLAAASQAPHTFWARCTNSFAMQSASSFHSSPRSLGLDGTVVRHSFQCAFAHPHLTSSFSSHYQLY